MIVPKEKKKKLAQTNLNPKTWSGGKEQKVTWQEGAGQGLHFNVGCCKMFFFPGMAWSQNQLFNYIIHRLMTVTVKSVKWGTGRKGRKEGNSFMAVIGLPRGEFRAISLNCHWLPKEHRPPKWGFLRLFVFLIWVNLTTEGFSTLGWKYKPKAVL